MEPEPVLRQLRFYFSENLKGSVTNAVHFYNDELIVRYLQWLAGCVIMVENVLLTKEVTLTDIKFLGGNAQGNFIATK